MTININGQELDFVLEEEKTAGDVITGLTKWLENSGLLVAGIRLDDRNVGLTDHQWRTVPVSDIRLLEIEAVNVRIGRVRQLETVRDYLMLLRDSAAGGDDESLGELAESYEDLHRMLPHLLDEGRKPVLVPHLEKVFGECGFPPDKDEGGRKTDLELLSVEAARMAALVESRLREASNPEKEAASAAVALASIAENLDDVAVNLQTGKDRKAMDTIIMMTETLQVLMRSLAWAGGTTADEVADDLNGILAELEEGLRAGDTVMIGDLLEYEIKPRLIDLPSRLNVAVEELQ